MIRDKIYKESSTQSDTSLCTRVYACVRACAPVSQTANQRSAPFPAVPSLADRIALISCVAITAAKGFKTAYLSKRRCCKCYNVQQGTLRTTMAVINLHITFEP